jgi:hypothetical protein
MEMESVVVMSVVVGGGVVGVVAVEVVEEAALVLGRGWPGELKGRAMLDTSS